MISVFETDLLCAGLVELINPGMTGLKLIRDGKCGTSKSAHLPVQCYGEFIDTKNFFKGQGGITAGHCIISVYL